MTAQKAVSVWIVVNIWCCWERGRLRETTVLHVESYRKMETNIFCETSVQRKAISFIIVANATATAAVVTLTNEWRSKTIYWANHSREWIPYIGKHEPFMGKYLQVIESGEYAIGLELLSNCFEHLLVLIQCPLATPDIRTFEIWNHGVLNLSINRKSIESMSLISSLYIRDQIEMNPTKQTTIVRASFGCDI